MRVFFLRFGKYRKFPNGLIHNSMGYFYPYQIIEKSDFHKPDRESLAKSFDISVWINYKKVEEWGLDLKYENVLYEIGKNYIADRLMEDNLKDMEALEINRSTDNFECPPNPEKIKYPLNEWIKLLV